MEFSLSDDLGALLQVIFLDLVLAGDNAIVVGMVAARLPAEMRSRVIMLGIGVAIILRIAFALVTVQLLKITGLLLLGGLLLLWVCWKLYTELEEQRKAVKAAMPEDISHEGAEDTKSKAKPQSLRQAMVQIILADLSMSLDNILAVAGVARDNSLVLMVGLLFSIIFMALAATVIARFLNRYPIIGYLGLVLIVYVAVFMIYDGTLQLLALS